MPHGASRERNASVGGVRHTAAVAESPDRGSRDPEAPLPRRHRRAHTTARDLERYAGLFAARTRVMRSSAMRDLMEITARPEVISLAGGLPDTSTFPPESFAAQMTRIAQESSAQALQYGPTEGFARDQGVHPRGDGAPRAWIPTPTTSSSPPAASRRSTWSPRRWSTPATR